MIQDHPKLGPLILPSLSYDILKFIKENGFSTNNLIIKELKKKIFEFNEIIIVPFNMIFLDAILTKVETK